MALHGSPTPHPRRRAAEAGRASGSRRQDGGSSCPRYRGIILMNTEIVAQWAQ